MSDAAHLLIPFAWAADPGCAQALAGVRLPALEQLLARLKPAGALEGDDLALDMPHERALARELGLAVPDGCVPWAALEVARDGRDHEGAAWAWVTPCHWQVGQDHITMAHPAHLALTAPESQALLAAMQPYFEEDGIALACDSPMRWLARGEVFRGFAAASLDRVIGRLVGPWLPQGASARTIRRLQQEMQMLLYTHEVNDARTRAGLHPVNSFWVSGAGALPDAAVPTRPAGLQVPQNLREAALLHDWAAWASAWREVDARECVALLAALERGEQVALTLCGERNARTFAGAGGGLLGKLAATLRRGRAAEVLATL